MKELEQAGLIRKEKAAIFGNKKLLRVTKLGRESMQAQEGFLTEVPQVKRVDLRTLQHDLVVASVRLRLEELWEGHWVPERALKREEYQEVPDGLFVFRSGKQIAIEVENTLKGRERFLILLARWRSVRPLMVLYVATQEPVRQALERYLAQGPTDVAFGLVSLSALLAPGLAAPRARSPQGELDLFSRKEF